MNTEVSINLSPLQGDENGLDYPLNEPPSADSEGDDYFYPSSDGSEYQDLDLIAVSGLVKLCKQFSKN